MAKMNGPWQEASTGCPKYQALIRDKDGDPVCWVIQAGYTKKRAKEILDFISHCADGESLTTNSG